MKFSFQTWLIIGLTVVIILLILFQPQPAQPSYAEYDRREELRKVENLELLAENTKLRHRIKQDSVSHKIEVKAYKDRDKKLSREIARIKANPIIVKVREEIAEVDIAFQTYDSLLASKDEQIQTQAAYIETLQVDLSKVTDNFLSRMKLQEETIQDLNTITEDQRKQLRKIRRANRWLKVATVVIGVAGLIGGSQL